MEYLFKHWLKFSEILTGRHIMLFLDYDGTLAPIAQRPEDAAMPFAAKRILKQLTRYLDLNIVIISGRALEDIKTKAGLKRITYVANHGLEIEGPRIRWRSNIPKGYKAILESIKNSLNKKISFIKGAFIENKGLSLALHYRLADKKYIPLVKAVFHADTILYLIRKKIKIRTGKMVLEVRPPLEQDKGKAVLWLLAKQRFLAKKQVYPVYIGDDKTDEDAFKALKNRGLAIFVGKAAHSSAKYYLKSTDDVLEFLKKILMLKKDAGVCQG